MATTNFMLQNWSSETYRSSIPTVENCPLNITHTVTILQKVTSISTFFFGVLGNIYVLVMFFRRPRTDWTYMNVYITNMAIADCALLVFLPFKIHYYDKELDEKLKGLCNFVLWVNYVNTYVSILTVTAISVVRYVAVKYPMRAKTVFSCRRSLVVCALIWLFVCSLGFLYFLKDSNNDKTMCFQRVKKSLSLHFVLLLSVVGFLLPFLVMLYCSVRVIYTLRQRLNIGARSKKIQCMFIIATNLIVFVICFFPVHLGYLIKLVAENNHMRKYSCAEKLAAHNFLHAATCISSMNCGLDCFIYFFATKTSWTMCCTKKNEKEEAECNYNEVGD
ncbi:G-protein coupled receptor 35.1 [Pseudorasbora parva]|uniref:G-protein coupled receptor 35.1 n=1 Tax=Pseudorasbora parva TaxID=51549 RepID=UPI00351E5F23